MRDDETRASGRLQTVGGTSSGRPTGVVEGETARGMNGTAFTMNAQSNGALEKKHAGRAKSALSKAQKATLRRMLEAKKAQLLRIREERACQAAEVKFEGVDVADMAEGVIEDRLRGALEEHDRALLAEIEHALAKIDAGTYGTSEMTGRSISVARMMAVPWARYDFEEAKRQERESRC